MILPQLKMSLLEQVTKNELKLQHDLTFGSTLAVSSIASFKGRPNAPEKPFHLYGGLNSILKKERDLALNAGDLQGRK